MNSNWYQLSVQDVVRQLETDPARGLTDGEAGRRLEKYGPNELIERGGRTSWQILVEKVTNILTLILIGAAAVSIFLGDILDAIVILAIVVLNALLGFSQEYRAEQAMAALKRMAVPTVRVRRDGKVQESVNMRVQESALTGESEAVDKEADLVLDMEKPLGDRRNMVYSGTIVNYGHGQMIVTETGMQTELGHIAEMIQSVEQEKTPLQRRLDRLGKVLATAALVLVAVIFVLGVLRGEPIEEMLLTAVSLAVAAIPEAMTAVVTIALSLGAQRMLKRRGPL